MNPVRPGPQQLQGLPTLTEVIELPAAAREAVLADTPGAAAPAPPVQGTVVAPPALTAVSDEQSVERVLGDLQRAADQRLETRLREALAPALARLADSLVSEVQLEFAAALREMAEQAVTRELARQRDR